jgi:ribose/xylose/arabinose/galactoside ABC-type transport system permease subunit
MASTSAELEQAKRLMRTATTTQSESGSERSSPTASMAVRSGSRWHLSNLLHRNDFQLTLAVLVLSAIYSLLYPDSFATGDNATNMARVAAILATAAIAQSFPLIVGGFDISIAATMGFVSIVAARWMTSGGGAAGGVCVAVLAGTAVGLGNGILVGAFRVTPFVATLGMMTFLRGLSDQLSDGGSIAGLSPDIAWLGRNNWGLLPSSVGIALIALVMGWFILTRTRAGLYLFAIGGSRDTARLSGVPVLRYEILAYSLSGFFAAIAGIMLTSRIGIGQATLGSGYELQSIATAVIGGVSIGGGVGRLSGVVLGVALLVVLTTGLDIAGINQFYQEMVTGAVLVAAVVIAQTRDMRWLPAWLRRAAPTETNPGELPGPVQKST